MRNRAVNPPAPSTVAVTSSMGDRTRRRVPRRIEHFQGELTTLEQRVLLHADGRIGFAEIGQRLGLSEQEVVAVALSLSGVGAIVLTAVPPPLPKRPASGTRPRVGMPDAANGADAADAADTSAIAMAEDEATDATPTEVEIDLDLSELERLIRPPSRR